MCKRKKSKENVGKSPAVGDLTRDVKQGQDISVFIPDSALISSAESGINAEKNPSSHGKAVIWDKAWQGSHKPA